MRTLKSISIVSAALLLGFFAGAAWRPAPVKAQHHVGYLTPITVVKLHEGKNDHPPVEGEAFGFACNQDGCFMAVK